MKKILTFGGIIIIVISLVISYNNIKQKNTELYGKLVSVEIIDIPITCEISSKRIKAFFKFRYNNKIYSKNLKDEYCEVVKTNRTIKLKTNSDNTIFIYPNENINQEILSNILLLAFGCLIFYKSRKYE